jgi:hypothetical protein
MIRGTPVIKIRNRGILVIIPYYYYYSSTVPASLVGAMRRGSIYISNARPPSCLIALTAIVRVPGRRPLTAAAVLSPS